MTYLLLEIGFCLAVAFGLGVATGWLIGRQTKTSRQRSQRTDGMKMRGIPDAES